MNKYTQAAPQPITVYDRKVITGKVSRTQLRQRENQEKSGSYGTYRHAFALLYYKGGLPIHVTQLLLA